MEKTGAQLTAAEFHQLLELALAAIKDGATDTLDPCIGDQGCQIRALPLCEIAIKVHGGVELSAGEKHFLVSLVVTWANTMRTTSKNGFFIREKTGNDIIPKSIQKNEYRGATRGQIMYHYRKFAAQFSLEFFRKSLISLEEVLPRALYDSLRLSFDQDQRNLNREMERIRCLPCLTSGLIILESVKKDMKPLIILVKRYSSDGDIFRLQRAVPVFYSPNGKGGYEPDLKCENHRLPCLCFEFYSFYRPKTTETHATYSEDFDLYLSGLKKLDVLSLIASNWAKHDQFPDVANSHIAPTYVTNPNELNREYSRLIKFDEDNHLPPIVQMRLAELAPEQPHKGWKTLKLLSAAPWFMLNHVYCSNLESRIAYCDEVNKHSIEELHSIVKISDKDHRCYENANIAN